MKHYPYIALLLCLLWCMPISANDGGKSTNDYENSETKVISPSSCVLNPSSSDSLSLDSALALARANNRRLLMAQQDIRKAEALRKEARTNYFPQVSLQAGGYHAYHPMLEYAASDIPNAAARDLLLTLYNDYGIALGLPDRLALLQQGAMATATAVQPLYMGGKIVAGNRLAEVGVQAARYQADIVERDLMQQTEEMYWLVVNLEEKQQTIASVAALLDTIHYQVETAIQAGAAMRSDLLAVELQQNEIALQQLRLTNGIALARQALAQAIGVSDEGFRIKDERQNSAGDAGVSPAVEKHYTENSNPKVISPSSCVLHPSSTNRPESSLLALQVKAATLEKRMTLAEALPQVALGAGVSYLGYTTTPYKSGAHDLPNGTAWNDKANGGVFLMVKVPLTDWWKTTHKLQQHDAAIQHARLEETELNEQMALQEQQAYNSMQEAGVEVTRYETAVQSAEENLRLTRLNYEAGLVSIADLLQNQSLLLQARNNLTDARIQLITATHYYQRLTGE
ncbi:MAG: TolC family protein [Paludibacteraceae bacterium]